MRKSILTIGAALLVTLGLGAVGTQALAAGDLAGASVEKGKTINGTYFASDKTLKIDGTVNGDVFCMGQTVTVSGTVNGDVICAGQTVTIDGTVNGDVRLAGQTIELNGKVENSATVMAQDVRTGKSFKIGRDLAGSATNVTVDGAIGRDVTVGSSSLTINGTVSRNVTADSNSVDVASGAEILGNLEYKSQDRAQIADGSVKGEVVFNQASSDQRQNDTFWAQVLASVQWVIIIALTILVVVALAPRPFIMASHYGRRNMLMVALLGVAGVIVLPILAIIAMMTIVGALLGVLLLLLWAMLLVASHVFAAVFAGQLLVRRSSENVLVHAAFGTILLVILYLLPFVNAIAGILVVLLGSGLALYFVFHSVLGKPRYRYAALEAAPTVAASRTKTVKKKSTKK